MATYLILCSPNSRNHGWIMENNGLGAHNDKMCAESLTGNTPNTPQFIRPICPNWPIIWDVFEKSPLHMSIVHDLYCIFIFSYFFFFFSRKVAHHRHFAENLSKVWGVMPRPRDLNEKYEVGKSGRKEMNKDYGSIASLINNEVSRHYKRNLNKVSL